MKIDAMPVWAILCGVTVFVVVAIEVGYRLGRRAHRQSEAEKESPVSAIAGSVLGLLAFMLAFTFGIVAARFDTRKALVIEEANAIRTAWLRTDILPQEGDRNEARALLREYLETRLNFAKSAKLNTNELARALDVSSRIRDRLWGMAITNAPPGPMNSDMSVLYLDALNKVFDLGARRLAVGIQSRVPTSIWGGLFVLMQMGMMCVGYQTGLAGSRRSNARAILAVSFSIVIALIASLDRPDSGVLRVSQQAGLDLLSEMDLAASQDVK